MTRLCHFFDESTGWEQRVAVSQLLDRLPGDRFINRLAVIDPVALDCLSRLGRPVEPFSRVARFTPMVAPSVAKFLNRDRIDLVHAWGLQAALGVQVGTQTPLVVELFDPQLAGSEIKLVRALARPKGFAVACSTETVRRRLVDGGVSPELCVVIRPGVDFALINRCRRGPLRSRLGVSHDHLAVIVPEPVSKRGGHIEAYRAVELVNHLTGSARIIVPGESREQRRIERFDKADPDSNVVVCPGKRYPFEELISISDALVMLPRGDESTTSIGWAMAAGAVVIGPAGYAVAELIASHVNGLLLKPGADESPAVAAARILLDRTSHEKARETARGHAYEVFGLRRYIDQHVRLYGNVLSGTAPGEGIVDSSVMM